GAVMLLILAAWLMTKNPDGSPVIPWLILITGLVSLGLCAWQGITLWLQKTTPEQKAVALVAQRRLNGMVMLAAGGLLLVLALVLGFGQAPSTTGGSAIRANFGETVGLILFALIALGAGYALLSPPREETAVNLEP